MSAAKRSRTPEGIEVYHRKACRSREGHRCNCDPSFRAKVQGPTGRIVSPRFPTLSAARNWLTDTRRALDRNEYIEPMTATLSELASDFIAGARAGHVLSRKGAPYKPSVVDGYASVLDTHVLPVLGDRRLNAVKRGDVQLWVDALVAAGLAPSTVRNALDPLRRICDRAVKRDVIPYSPCDHVEVPRGSGIRDRVASPDEALALIAALPEVDRALWATAMYAGLRVSELRALRWNDVDLEQGVLHVRRTKTDSGVEQIGGKSDAAMRTVAVIGDLRRILLPHKLATGRSGDDLVFGRTPHLPFVRSTIRARALAAWKSSGLVPITPHEARHTFGSMLAAAGIDVSERQRQMGHASSAMMDRYTHGFPDSVTKAGGQLQDWISEHNLVGE
jgi:integrase